MNDSGESESSQDEHWGDSAAAWARAAEEEETGASASATEWMLQAAAPRPGEQVLEVAGGAGRVGLQAAAPVEPGGNVLCSDFAEGMVEAVRERIARNGIGNAEARLLDAQDLDLEDESFDIALCRFGYMLMPKPRRALAESHRVLRPGGRLILAVWGEASKNPWLSTILDAVMEELGAPPPEPGTPGPFALGEPAQLKEMLEQAGLAEVEVTEIDTEQAYDSLEGWWRELKEVSGPLTALLDALPTETVEKIEAAAFATAHQYVGEDGKPAFPAVVVGARGVRSGG